MAKENRFVKQPGLFYRMAVQDARVTKKLTVLIIPYTLFFVGFLFGELLSRMLLPAT